MNKKILVIKMSPYNGLNSSTMRTIAMLRGLILNGYEVDWLTIKPSDTHVLNDLSQYPFLKDVHFIFANGNTVYNNLVKKGGGTFKSKCVSLLRKIYHKFYIYDFTAQIAKNVKLPALPCDEYQYVISVSDPKTGHIAAKSLLKQGLKYEKWIQYWGDPLVGDITQKSIYPSWIMKFFEKSLFSDADRIVYTSPFTMEEEQKRYPRLSARMIYTPTAYIEPRIYEEHEKTKFRVGYYGDYKSSVRNIMPLYNAFSNFCQDIELVIFGDSDLNLDETESVTIRPRGDARAYEEKTDLFVCMLNSTGTQIPGKLYHYAATNRPILVLLDGERKNDMKNYLESFDRYIMCENDSESIQKSILQIKQEHRDYPPSESVSPQNVAAKILGI